MSLYFVSAQAQTDFSQCLVIDGISSKVIETNTSFSTVSWQTAVTNNCDSAVRASFLFKLFDAQEFELDSDSVFDYFLPRLETTVVTSTVLVTADKIGAVSTSSIQITDADATGIAILGDPNNCLRVNSLGSLILDSNSTFQERSWKTEISNACDQAFDLRVEFRFYDNQYFELDTETLYDVHVPANDVVNVSDLALVSPPSLAANIALQSARIARADITDTGPTRQRHFKWLDGALSHFNTDDNRLRTTVNAINIGIFDLEMLLESDPTDIVFSLDGNSLKPLNSVPAGAATFSPSENILSMPAARVVLDGNASIMEDLRFRLIDAANWLFRLEQSSDPHSPTRQLKGAGTCLLVGENDSSLIEVNDVFAELSWKATISNQCAQSYSVDIRFAPFTDDDYMLDESTQYGVLIGANQSVTVTKRLLVSPPSKLELMAKQMISIETR